MARVGPRERVLAICSGLPGVVAEGEPHVGFTVGGRRFAWFLDDHHGDGRVALNCRAAEGAAAELVAADPGRLFVPSYLGARGWVGAWLDVPDVDWDRVEKLLLDAYRLSASRRRVAELDAR